MNQPPPLGGSSAPTTETPPRSLPYPYTTVAAVRALNAFPDIENTVIDGYIHKRASEYNTVLMGRGITLPLTGPDDFLEMLGMGVMYGAAASIEAAPQKGQDPQSMSVGVTMYLAEYTRILDYIQGLTDVQLVNLGLLTREVFETPGETQPGLLMATAINQYPFRTGRHWSDYPPFRK